MESKIVMILKYKSKSRDPFFIWSIWIQLLWFMFWMMIFMVITFTIISCCIWFWKFILHLAIRAIKDISLKLAYWFGINSITKVLNCLSFLHLHNQLFMNSKWWEIKKTIKIILRSIIIFSGHNTLVLYLNPLLMFW